MLRTYCWPRLVLAATLWVASALSVLPAAARGDELIASFAAGNLECQQAAKPPLARPVALVNAVQEIKRWVTFGPADLGPARGVADHRRKPTRTLTAGQALRKQLTLSALILMIFDVPAMPAPETTDTTTVATGLSGQGLVQTPTEVISSSSSPSPPTASEPAGLLLGLWGVGLIGVYVLLVVSRNASSPRVNRPLSAVPSLRQGAPA